MDALSANSISKQYTQHLALDNVSLNVPKGSIYGLLGPNGAGKTTFIRIINQIINADAGEITIFNEPLHEKHIATIGYLPEERGLYKKLKVGDQLIYLARLKGLSKSDALDKLKVWFTKFEIKDWWDKKVEDLSKGMAQKVQFVSTVLHQPKLVILDEPFSGFDPVNAQLITKEILEMRENGATIIFSTHRMETVEELCDYIALINKSKKILEGPKKEVKESYKSNTFLIEHRGGFALSSDNYELLEQLNPEDSFFKSTVRIRGTVSPNQLIRDLIELTEVHGIIEKIPTMSEIFISLVKDDQAA